MNPLNFDDPVAQLPIPSLNQGGHLVLWLFAIGLFFFLLLTLLKMRGTDADVTHPGGHIATWLRKYYWVAMLMTGITLVAVATKFYLVEIGYSVAGIVNTLRVEAWSDAPNAEDLSNLATATAVLLAALAAAATMIFQLVKVWITERQTTTSEQSHITDQINKAVAGLGAEKNVKSVDGAEAIHPNIEVRVGAIYALERIAQDSPRDHVQIMEILTAYIRENAPANRAQKSPHSVYRRLTENTEHGMGLTDEQVYQSKEYQDNKPFGWTPLDLTPRNLRLWANHLKAQTDTQAAMQVIGRRTEVQRRIEQEDKRYGTSGYCLDLRDCNLQAVDMSGLNLSRARLSGSHLEGTNLDQTNLSSADVTNAHLEGASLVGTYLIDTTIDGTCFDSALLAKIRFGSVITFYSSSLTGAGLRELNLKEAEGISSSIYEAFGDSTVELSLSLSSQRPEHWLKRDLNELAFKFEWLKWLENPTTSPPPKNPS